MSENKIQLIIEAVDKGSEVVKKFSGTIVNETKRMSDQTSQMAGVVGRVQANYESLYAGLGRGARSFSDMQGRASALVGELGNMGRATGGIVQQTANVATVQAKASAGVAGALRTIVNGSRQMAGGFIESASKMAGSMITGLGGAISTVGSRLTSLKTLAVASLAGWGVERLITGFIDTGSSMDKMRIALDTITKGEGEAWFKRLNEWAMKMPINTEAAIKNFTMLRGMGLKPSIADMQVLLDTTSALGGQADTLTGIALAIGQISAKGAPQMEELRQLAERGIPVFEILGSKLKLTGAQINDIGNQAVTSGEVIKALVEGMAERFGGMSEKIQKKFSGLMEGLKGYWTEFQRRVMDSGVMKSIETALTQFMDNLDKKYAGGAFQTWADKVAESVILAARKITMAAAGVVDFMTENIPKIAAQVGGLWGAFMSLPEWVRDAGLIGAFIYGKKGAVVLGGALVLINAIKNQAAGLGLVASGKLKFTDFAGMNSKEMKEYLDKFNQENPISSGRTFGPPDPEEFAPGSAKKFMATFWAELGTEIEAARGKVADAAKGVINEAGVGLTNIQVDVQAVMQKQAEAAIKIAEADKKALEGRLQDYRQYYDSLRGLIEKNAETEKKHIEELNGLYRQQADLRKSTEAQIRGLQEIGMSPLQKYESQKGALTGQFTAAMQLSGQEQVKALEEYKQSLVSFGQAWGQGIQETTQSWFGAETRVYKSGKDIISSVIADIQAASSAQQQALKGLAEEKQRQIEADQKWGQTLVQTAQEAQAEIEKLSGLIGELEEKIALMQKTITIKGDDQVSSVVDNIARNLASLHDKTIYITTIQRSLPNGESINLAAPAPEVAGSGMEVTSYARGTNYVPFTGLYRLHAGEIVVPPEESREIRRQAALRGAAAGLQDGDDGVGYGTTLAPQQTFPSPLEKGGLRGIYNYIAPAPPAAVERRVSVTYGDIIINVPESAAPQTPEDWRAITREHIIPELRKAGHA